MKGTISGSVSGRDHGAGVQALERGLRAVEALAATPAGLSVSELASQLQVSRPAVYRMLATLEAHGLISRREDGRARLGLGVLVLARGVPPLVADLAVPVLRHLAETTGATAHLTLAEGDSDSCVAVAVVEPTRTDFHVAYRVGARHRIDQGAAGRAILAARGGETSGFVVTEGELQAGAIGVAAPVLGIAGLEASVGLVALGPRFDARAAGSVVLAAARALSAAMS